MHFQALDVKGDSSLEASMHDKLPKETFDDPYNKSAHDVYETDHAEVPRYHPCPWPLRPARWGPYNAAVQN